MFGPEHLPRQGHEGQERSEANVSRLEPSGSAGSTPPRGSGLEHKHLDSESSAAISPPTPSLRGRERRVVDCPRDRDPRRRVAAAFPLLQAPVSTRSRTVLYCVCLGWDGIRLLDRVRPPSPPHRMHDHALTDTSTCAQPPTLDDPACGRTLGLLQEAQNPARCLQDVLPDRGKSSARNQKAQRNPRPLMHSAALVTQIAVTVRSSAPLIRSALADRGTTRLPRRRRFPGIHT